MKKFFGCFIFSIFILTGCATNNNSMQTPTYTQLGTVIGVRNFVVVENNGVGTGMVVGGVTGGILGHQVGKGNGKKAATIVGALVGAGVGNAVTQSSTNVNMVELTIQESNHNLMTITQPLNYNYFVGQQVTIIKQGQKAQVNP